jgi:hypothetical protein
MAAARTPAGSTQSIVAFGQGGDMSLSTRLDRLEAALRGRDGGDTPDGRWICPLIYDPIELQIEESHLPIEN